MTGMNSDLPGTVVAQVTRNVYDSAAQRDVLVPAGTRLVGEYDDQIAYGQNRALVAWTRMLFPDGTSVEVPGLPSTDRQGYAGMSRRGGPPLRPRVRLGGPAGRRRRGRRAGGAGPRRASTPPRRPRRSPRARWPSSSRAWRRRLVRRGLDVEPTLRVAPGYRFYVLLARDLPFAGPYRPRPGVGRFARPR